MESKKDKQLFFEVKLNWLSGSKGVLSSDHIDQSVHVGLPHEFGGEGREWSPEHLFLSSVSSCFMMTLLAFSKKLQFTLSRFECDVIGRVENIEGRYKFTRIDLYPKVYIPRDALSDKASLALQKTQKHCLVSNSINAEVYYHIELLVEMKDWSNAVPAAVD